MAAADVETSHTASALLAAPTRRVSNGAPAQSHPARGTEEASEQRRANPKHSHAPVRRRCQTCTSKATAPAPRRAMARLYAPHPEPKWLAFKQNHLRKEAAAPLAERLNRLVNSLVTTYTAAVAAAAEMDL